MNYTHSVSAQPPSLPQLAWAAGFLDGEGCIRIAKRDPGGDANYIYSLNVSITQNCLPTLEHFKEVLGVEGSICVFSSKNAVRSPVFTLTYNCTKARAVLELLRPFLVRKQREAEVGIEFAERATFVRKGRRRHSDAEIALREAYYLQLRALKPRGPTAVVQ